jgi:hypothetical protein
MVIFAMILLVAWNAWFFLAQISITEISQSASFINGSTIVADFEPPALARMALGQSAFLQLEGATEPIKAIVTDVWEEQIRLIIQDDAVLSADDSITQVDVEVEQVSPATLIMRASGLLSESEG